ncbi:MAG: hypothetical protein ACMXYF_01265 [Candidatus Woesearchaeota archaeon]
MGIEKILVINDDGEDALAMKKRINSQVDVASQFQAQMLDNLNYDLVILDNDANNMQDAKGSQTLAHLREKGMQAPVIFTSFQPGWVQPSVYQTKGVRVVRTDRIFDEVKKQFGIPVLEQTDSRPAIDPKLSIVMSYNPIEGYNEGLISGKVLVLSYERFAQETAKQVIAQKTKKIFGSFDWKSDRELIKNVFVYDGLHSRDNARYSAAALGHDIRLEVNMLACRCNWKEKENFARSMYVKLFPVSCGGTYELGMVVDTLLGIQRPGVDYNQLSMTREQILTPANRYGGDLL